MTSKNTLTVALLTGLITLAVLYILGVAIEKDSGYISSYLGFRTTAQALGEEVVKEPVLVEEPPVEGPIRELTKRKALINVAVISQMPELFNGCEITSLTMLLQYSGEDIDKMKLSQMIAKDPAPMVKDADGEIVSWGNPHKGFVGDINGYHKGFGVFHEPIAQLINKLKPGQALDLTGKPFEDILLEVQDGKPVVVWTNTSFALLTSGWMTWSTADGPIKGTWKEHAVLLVGYDQNYLYINDPRDGTKAKKVSRVAFIESWKQMGSQAVTYQTLQAKS